MTSIASLAKLSFGQLIYVLFNAIAWISVIQCSLEWGPIRPLQALVDKYREISNFAALLLRPLIHYILVEWFLVEVPFNNWWVQLFLPLSLYSGSIAYGVWRAHKRKRWAVTLLASFLLISLLSSLLASIWPLDESSGQSVLIVSLGLVMISIVAIVYHAIVVAPTLIPPEGRRRNFLRFSAFYPGLNLCIAIGVVLSAYLSDIFLEWEVPSVVQLGTIVSVMSLRDIAGGVYGATCERSPSESWWVSFWAYATTVQGARNLAVLLVVVAALRNSVGLLQCGAQ